MRVVVREIDCRLHYGAQARALARRMFHRGGRQHAEAVDVEQGAKEHPRTRRVLREDQTENPMHGD